MDRACKVLHRRLVHCVNLFLYYAAGWCFRASSLPFFYNKIHFLITYFNHSFRNSFWIAALFFSKKLLQKNATLEINAAFNYRSIADNFTPHHYLLLHNFHDGKEHTWLLELPSISRHLYLLFICVHR